MIKKAKYLLLIVVLLTFPMIQNCGTNSSSTSSIIVGDTLINEGWDFIKVGNYTSARNSFEQALNENLSEAQRINANNGYGWALSRDGKVSEAIPYFEKAYSSDNEAKVGLAGCLIYRHLSNSDYVRAAEILGNMPPEKFAQVHSGLSLSTAKVHALAALAYALSGDKANATTYMNKAAALDSLLVGSTVDKIDNAFYLLGWKD